MEQVSRRSPREFLRAITNPELLSKYPLIALTILTTLVHLISSIDLGFRNLPVRIPLAAISIIPAILVIWLAHVVSRREHVRFVLIPLAYLIGGALRGALLEALLREANVLPDEGQSFRVIAGMMIVSTTCVLVSYNWTVIRDAMTTISALRLETAALSGALEDLRSKSEESNREEMQRVQDRISQELLRAIEVGSVEIRTNLEKMINLVVRPLSQDFAREIKGWEPPSIDQLKLTMGTFWSFIDPLKHLRTPIVGVAAIILSTIASLFALFDIRNAVEAIVGASLSYLVSFYIVFALIGRFFKDLKPPLRELLLTASFVVISIPAVFVQRIALADTEDPNIYVVATLVTTPVFGWLIIIGTAALGLTQELTRRLNQIKDDLRWAIARINLLTWYQKGVISRMLHGPVQNSIQVALLRMRSADESESMQIVNEVIERIDHALQEVLDPKTSTVIEMQTLHSIEETWKSVADVEIEMTEECRRACSEDIAASSIVTDLVQELCSNAIRHGNAKRIRVNADVKEGSMLIDVIDDGTFLVEKKRSAGLGMQFLDSCSIDWERRIVDDQNELSLRVPTSYDHSLGANLER